MQDRVNCCKCGRGGSAKSMHYEAEHMVVKLGIGNDIKHRRLIHEFVVKAAEYYCGTCYNEYESILQWYQNERTYYLSLYISYFFYILTKHITNY